MSIRWHESLLIGVATIDAQHKELVSRFNQLLEACEMEQGAEELKKMLVFLDKYSLQHFKDEEELQRLHKYPNLAAHKKEHESFTLRINNLKDQIEREGVTVKHLIDTNKFLVQWLIHHISLSDGDIGTFLKEETA